MERNDSAGVAVGWHAAQGGLALAGTFAMGGEVMATHANDPAAREFFQNLPWLDISNPQKRSLFILLNWAPMMLFVWFLTIGKRKQRRSS